MRVIAGSARSLRLSMARGASIRPTSDAMREALFSSLGPQVVGCRFLDLYAGTGAVGIEALSRGAEACVFIEQNRRGVEALRHNLANTHLADRATVVVGDCRRLLGRVLEVQGPFGIVFLDPPYGDQGGEEVAAAIMAAGGRPPGRLVIQHARSAAPQGLGPPLREQRFGETVLSHFALSLRED
jgi:16S rRNA (guanine(966)-N(2))-methyltransferase RsmD